MIYLDYAASNPIDSRVQTELAESLNLVGNPSAVHAFGRLAREKIDEARAKVAALLHVALRDVTFTSGATEANNLALLGYFRRLRELYGPERELRLLVSTIEHSSIRGTLGRLAVESNVTVDRLPVGADGVVQTDSLPTLITETTVMVCVMWVNNVIGSVQPIDELARAVEAERQKRGLNGLPLVLMSDAVQALRTEDVQPNESGVDILTMSSHKIYGPKGCGALYVRTGVELAPLLTGGEQEDGLRAGTENLLGIIGLGRAAELLAVERTVDRTMILELSRQLRDGLRSISNLDVMGDETQTTPGILYVTSRRDSGDVLTVKLDVAGVAVSSGAACDAGTRKTDAVLREIGSGQAAKRGGIRISLGRFTTVEDIATVIRVLKNI
ncbi:MAG: cysteine desulfurase family protein [Patescibacteria group bacterium]